MSKNVVFNAALAPKWLTLDKDGEARVVLLASASELSSVMSLSILGEALLKITVEVVET